MPKTRIKKLNHWKKWNKLVKDFEHAWKKAPPDIISRHWQRYLMVFFMQELSKNILKKEVSLIAIIGKIMEAIHIGYGFERVRFYQVEEHSETGNVLRLKKKSKGHIAKIKIGDKLETEYKDDDAVATLKSGEPLVVHDAIEQKLNLKYKDDLKIVGPYVAIPLFAEGEPYGLICGDTVSDEISSNNIHRLNYLEYKEHFISFASTIIAAVDNKVTHRRKEDLVEEMDDLLEMRNEFLEMLNLAVEKAGKLNLVLEIIRDSCYKLVHGIDKVCLPVKDLHTGELVSPSVKCGVPHLEIMCAKCFQSNDLIRKALKTKPMKSSGKELAIPILKLDEAIGVLYLEGKTRKKYSRNEIEILAIIAKTAAILITTARDYERKIKQSTAFYEAGQLSTKMSDFGSWFNSVMGKVMDIIGPENRNFHLVMKEEKDGINKLIVKGTSDLNLKERIIPMKDKLLGIEIPMENSLSGKVIREKRAFIIPDVEANLKLKDGDPEKLPIYNKIEELFNINIKAEVALPLIINEGNEGEQVIGVLVIDSVIPGDFKEEEFDLQFHEAIAKYLAVVIHNQQLYEARAKAQVVRSRKTLDVSNSNMMQYFSHQFKDPIQRLKTKLAELEEEKKLKDEDIEDLRGPISEQGKIFEKLQNMFISRNSRGWEQKRVYELVKASLDSTANTTGLAITLGGNYEANEHVIDCFPDDIEVAFNVIINNAVKYSRQLPRDKRYLNIDIFVDEAKKLNIAFESSTIEQIPPEKQKTIFEFGKRGTERERGDGLGLAFANLCINQGQSGDIEVENIEKNAVKFTVKIPVEDLHQIKGGII